MPHKIHASLPRVAAAAITCSFMLLAAGCGGPQDRATADAWLAAKAGASDSNVEGRWAGPMTGYGILSQQPFGTITLAQEGNRLTGQMPDYQILGTVRGASVYMIGIHGDKIYYTFHLTLAKRLKPRAMMGNICFGYHPEVNSKCNGIQFRER